MSVRASCAAVLSVLVLAVGFERTASAQSFPTVSGPVSKLYVTSADTNGWIIQGGTATPFVNNAGPGTLQFGIIESVIAVRDTVRTLASISGEVGGGQYSATDGAFIGPSYTNVFPSTVVNLDDGAQDATHNYTVDFNSGIVWRTESDWSSPTQLFFAGFVNTFHGITYDATDNTLWITDQTTIYHYTMTGSVLGSFGGNFGMGMIALDPADNTLWVSDWSPSPEPHVDGRFSQFTKSGTLLGKIVYANITDFSADGGEFAFAAATPVPEPSSLALGGIAAMVSGFFGWRRRLSESKRRKTNGT